MKGAATNSEDGLDIPQAYTGLAKAMVYGPVPKSEKVTPVESLLPRELRYHHISLPNHSSMLHTFTAAHHSATGLREYNEDFAGFMAPDEPEQSAKGMIAAIADGVSGSGGGREAAEYCVRGLLADFYAMPDSLAAPEVLGKVISTINQKLHRPGDERSSSLRVASTLTSLVVRGDTYFFSHVGDSRLYLLRSGTLQQLTTDHVRESPELRHVLQRAIGLDAHIDIEHGSGKLQVGDIFLLATDGLWGALTESDMEWHLSTLTQNPPDPNYTAKLLVDAAVANGTKDNATALVVRICESHQTFQPAATAEKRPTQAQHDPLALWKLIGAVSLAVNLLLLFMLIGR